MASRTMEHQKLIFLEHDKIRTYTDGIFTESTSSEIKELPCGAIVPLSLLSTHILKLSNRLNADDLRIQVEIRMFEEGNLNSEDEYTIDFIRHEISSDDSILVEIFALSHTKAQEFFSVSLNKTHSIDLITPGFMIYHHYYLTHEPKNDLFIYWGEEEAFAAIYQDGSYIAHRVIETLASMAVETGLDLVRLKKYLSTRGVIEENYPPEEFAKFNLIQERISKSIERIVQTINHKRGLFSLSGVDRVYLDFEGETIPGLEETFKAYGTELLSVSPLARDNAAPQNIHDALCADYLLSPQTTFLNLSPYGRKTAWYKRESGKLLTFFGGSAALVLVLSLALAWMISSQEDRHQELNSQLETLKNETKPLAAQLKHNKDLFQEQKNKNQILKDNIALLHGAQETALLIDDIHFQRQRFLQDVSMEMGRYKLGALLMEQNSSKNMTIHVVSDYRKRDDIAKLMRGLYDKGYQDVQTQEIRLDNNTTTYGSVVKVTR